MLLIPLLLAAGASSEVWIATSGAAPPACQAPALSSAVQVLRPHLRLHTGDAPGGALQVTLDHTGNSYTIRLSGPEINVARVFPDRGDCEAAIHTGALIVDGALDDLSLGGDAPSIDRLAPIPLEWAIAAGGSVEQGSLGVMGAPELELRFTRGLLTGALSGDVQLPTLSPQKGEGQIQLTAGSIEAAIGLAPRLGRGRLTIESAAGMSITSAALVNHPAIDPTNPMLFHVGTQYSALPFVALRAGYVLHLPRHLFLLVRIEERLAQSVTFVVDGPSASQAETRQWTLVGTLALGWRFH